MRAARAAAGTDVVGEAGDEDRAVLAPPDVPLHPANSSDTSGIAPALLSVARHWAGR